MEGELKNLIFVWISAVASFCYCYYVAKSAAVGHRRLFALLPVLALFLVLPLYLTSITLGGLTSFFLTWLADFKLLLFAFGGGPLASADLSLSHFIATACFPIKLQGGGTDSAEISTNGLKSPINYAAKFLILAALVPLYEKKDQIHPSVTNLMYGVYMYIALELWLALAGALARRLVGVQLEPQFEEPYLSTSLQDFWGRRWNLMVTSILRPTVYDPVRSIAARFIGRRWASLPAAFSTFVVSGLMHELIFYYIGRREPTWVVTCFFLLQGISVAAEIAVKKAVRWRLPAVVSCPLTVTYVAATGLWLFLPPLLSCDAEAKVRQETVVVLKLVTEIWEIARCSAITIVSR